MHLTKRCPWTGVASNHAAPLVPKVLLDPVGHLSIQLSHVKNVKFKSSCPELGAFVPLRGHWQCVRLFRCHKSGWGATGIQRVETRDAAHLPAGHRTALSR